MYIVTSRPTKESRATAVLHLSVSCTEANPPAFLVLDRRQDFARPNVEIDVEPEAHRHPASLNGRGFEWPIVVFEDRGDG